MKTFKMLIGTLFFISLAFFGFAGVSLADEHGKTEIQNLKDAATALKTTNPNLSAQLSKYADKEVGEKEGMEEKEGEENEAANVKLLQDSATALTTSNPALADALTKYAKKEAWEEKEEREEKK